MLNAARLKSSAQRHIVTLFLLMLLLSLPALAQAADSPVIAVSQCNAIGDTWPIDAVETYTAKNTVYLFLPGAWGKEPLHLWFTGAEEASFEGLTVHSGDPVDLSPYVGGTAKLVIGKRSYQLRVMQGSPIPALFLQTETGSLKKIETDKSYKEPGLMRMLDGSGSVAYDGPLAHIKMRGNMSTRFSKKSYTIKLEKSTDLLGMGKAKKWVLIGNARDHSLLRNQLTLDMARFVGLNYTPQCTQADVYINGEYRGIYLFSEKVEIKKSRIAITDLEEATEQLNDAALSSYPMVGAAKETVGAFKAYQIPVDPDDITGGYLVEYEKYDERYQEEASAYYTLKKKVIVVKSPEYASEAQMAYISALMQRLENAIFAADGIDPESGLHLSQIADMESLAKKFMVEEISKNYDGSNSSQYFYKPADSESTLLYAGPAWDYDSAWGSYGHSATDSVLLPNGFYHTTLNRRNNWWAYLYTHAEFQAAVRAAWAESYDQALAILSGEQPEAGGLLSIDHYAQQVEASAAMNFIRWPMLSSSSNAADTGKTFEANIRYLKTFVQKRWKWLAGKWGT